MKIKLIPFLLLILTGCTTINVSSNPNTSVTSGNDSSTVVDSSSDGTSTTQEDPTSSQEPVVGNKLKPLTNIQTIEDFQLSKFKKSALPSTGNIDLLVIPVEIKDKPFPAGYASKLETVFNGTSAETGWESTASFFNKSSYGSLNFNFEIANKYTTKSNASVYQREGQSGDSHIIKETMDNITGIADYSKYDSNKDGYVDATIFIYSTPHNYNVEPWWAWVFHNEYNGDDYNPEVSPKDGVKFGYYTWIGFSFINEDLPNNPVNANAETFTHEFGHLLGFPDLYATAENNPYDVTATGGWDMMDANNGDNGPLQKLLWGWIDANVAEEKGTYHVELDKYTNYSNRDNKVIIVPSPTADFSDGDIFDEFLAITYYRPEGLYRGHIKGDIAVSKPGIVIYKLDATLSSSASFWDFFKNDNNGRSNFLVDILEADKNDSLPTKGYNYITDSDILTSGSIDLSDYEWNTGEKINVNIKIDSLLSTGAKLQITIL